MMYFQGHPSIVFRRSIAVLGLALVVLLNILSVSPGLHAWFHGDGSPGSHCGKGCDQAPLPDDSSPHPQQAENSYFAHVCAVTLFSGGVCPSLLVCLLMLVGLLVRSIVLREDNLLALAQAPYTHVPSHAPPLV